MHISILLMTQLKYFQYHRLLFFFSRYTCIHTHRIGHQRIHHFIKRIHTIPRWSIWHRTKKKISSIRMDIVHETCQSMIDEKLIFSYLTLCISDMSLIDKHCIQQNIYLLYLHRSTFEQRWHMFLSFSLTSKINICSYHSMRVQVKALKRKMIVHSN